MKQEEFDLRFEEIKKDYREHAHRFAEENRRAAFERAESSRREAARYLVIGAAGGISLLATQIPVASNSIWLALLAIVFFAISGFCSIRSLQEAVVEQLAFAGKWVEWSMSVLVLISPLTYGEPVPDLPEAPKPIFAKSDQWAGASHAFLILGGFVAMCFLISWSGGLATILGWYREHFTPA